MNELLAAGAVDFLLGCVIGSGVVGSSVQRTLGVANGDIATTTYSSVINSAAYYISVYFIAKDNLVGYAGTVVGSTLTVLWMANKNKEANGKKDI